MREHYLIPFLFGVLITGIIHWRRAFLKKKLGEMWWIHLYAFFTVYTTIVFMTYFYEWGLYKQLRGLDLNNDGVYSTLERTDKYIDLTQKIVNDTARNLVGVTAWFYAAIITVSLHLMDRIRKNFNPEKYKHE